jgi:hypothetical protein
MKTASTADASTENALLDKYADYNQIPVLMSPMAVEKWFKNSSAK